MAEIVEREERNAMAIKLEKEQECQMQRAEGIQNEKWQHFDIHMQQLKKGVWGTGEERNTEGPDELGWPRTTTYIETTTLLKGTGECPPCEKVCSQHECQPRFMRNSLRRGYTYVTELPKYRKTGCCDGKKGACDLCCPDASVHPPSRFFSDPAI